MIISKCQQCHKKSFYPRIRKYNFEFLPMGIITSQDKLCGKCFNKVVYAIRKSHRQLRPPVWFIIRFYVGKAIYNTKQLWKIQKFYRYFFPIKCANCKTKLNVYAETELKVKDNRPLCDDCCYKINGYG